MQSNTMLCKGKMNFGVWRKKMREGAGAPSRFRPGSLLGEGPGELFDNYLAATADSTSILSPSTVPYTVAFCPA